MEYLAGDYDGCNDRSRLWECKADYNKNQHFEHVNGHVYAPVVSKFTSKNSFDWKNGTLDEANWIVADDTLIERYQSCSFMDCLQLTDDLQGC